MKENGFTLVELVMTVALVSILSIPVLPQLANQKTETTTASALQQRYGWMELLNNLNKTPK